MKFALALLCVLDAVPGFAENSRSRAYPANISAAAPGQDIAAEERKAGVAEYRRGHFSQAEALLRRALQHSEKQNDRYDIALNRVALGDVYQAQARYNKAERAYRSGISSLRLLKQMHALAISLRNLGEVLSVQRKYAEALNILQEASIHARTIRPSDLQLEVRILDTFGVTYFRQGDFSAAELYFLRALDTAGANSGTVQIPSEDFGQVVNNLATIYLQRKQYSAAEQMYTRALRALEQAYGPTDERVTITLNSLGYALLLQGRSDEAEVEFQRSRGIRVSSAWTVRVEKPR